ncbi:MAG: lipoprotein signal peptidase [Flavobacteriales bacterium]
MRRALVIILLVLLADQALKVWVKLNFAYGEAVPLFGDWAYLHFIENRGMAFGMEFGGEGGKLALTWLRIAAVLGIGYGLRRMVAHGAGALQVVSVSLVFAGALGNIIDSVCYGKLFSASTPFRAAELLPAEGGYGKWFHGAVVDMFHFPIWRGRFPQWVPGIGGEAFEFFQPVFNVADAAITVGIGLYIVAQRRARRRQALPMATAPDPRPADAGPVMAGDDASGASGA